MHLITGYANENHVTSANDGVRNSMLFDRRCFLDSGKKFEANIINNNLIRIYDGYGVMDGRLFEIPVGEYEDVVIDNGNQNKNRCDLIVARYEKNRASGIETIRLVVIKGEPSTEEYPPHPEHIEGNILEGDDVVDFPLLSVIIRGLEIYSISELVFTISTPIVEVVRKYEREAVKMKYIEKAWTKTLSANEKINAHVGLTPVREALRDITNLLGIMPILREALPQYNIKVDHLSFPPRTLGSDLHIIAENLDSTQSVFYIDAVIYYTT